MDGDLEWLLSQLPLSDRQDVMGVRDRIRPTLEYIRRLDARQLPHTIGLFGSWGTGKTTMLGFMAKDFLDRGDEVIYFNAWKYAGFMEVVPALIYKVLTTVAEGPEESRAKNVTRVMLSLGKKYSAQFGEWARDQIGVNPVSLFRDVVEAYQQEGTDPLPARRELLNDYYTQLDRAQDMLGEILAGRNRPVMVLVDELDRCDPGEAFEILKQLRVFFAMRNVPLVFVMSVNPEPIGLAIQHQYGLHTAHNDYESRRILEKFVDTYMDATTTNPQDQYVRGIWSASDEDPDDLSLILALDSRVTSANWAMDTVRNAKGHQAISMGNRLYSNLRVLKKTAEYVADKSESTQVWTLWHLEMLKQLDMDLRRDVAKLAAHLRMVTERAHLDTLRELAQNSEVEDGSIELDSSKGATAFAVYRSYFWEIAKSTPPDQMDRRGLAQKLIDDYHMMDFVILMTLVRLDAARSQLDLADKYLDRIDSGTADGLLVDWEGQFGSNHLSWLLANY